MRTAAALLCAFLVCAAPPAGAAEPTSTSAPGTALERLKQGNARFAENLRQNIDLAAQRAQSAKGQVPFAAVLACADSRLSPEHIFDRGIGELFVVRAAGNVAGTMERASIEYGALHLRIPLLVVMGHTRCGAVEAAASGGKEPGSLPALLALLQPAVDETRRISPPIEEKSAFTTEAARRNVLLTMRALLRDSPVLQELHAKGALVVTGALYHVDDGKIEWLEKGSF